MRATRLHLATSADAGADASRVVGYGAFALEYAASARLAEIDRERLLSACMTALQVATRASGKAPNVRLDRLSPALSAWRATFVTLTENERLRGCIGSLKPRRPLIDDAVANTAQAGFADPRFPPLKESELTGLRLDVSILSHPRPIPAASESELAGALEPDRDGLILSAGKRRALFLPSVWRHLPDARTFVRHSDGEGRLSSRITGRKASRRGAFGWNPSARHGGRLIRKISRWTRSTQTRSNIKAQRNSLQRSAPKAAPSLPPKMARSKKVCVRMIGGLKSSCPQ